MAQPRTGIVRTSLRNDPLKGLQKNINNKIKFFYYQNLVRLVGFEPATYELKVGFKAKTTGKNRQQKVN